MYHVPLAFQSIYRLSVEGCEDGHVKEGDEISGGRERLEITWPLVCR